MKPILTLIFLLIFLSGISENNVNPGAPKFRNLNFENGISNLSIHSFAQDNQGYIWIATARGLNRYDGISFTHFLFENNDHSLYHNNVVKLHTNFDGTLFCATGYGVNIYNPATDKIQRIESNNELYLDFIDFEGKTYGISYLGGLFGYNKDKQSFDRVHNFPQDIIIENLVSDKETGIWGKTIDNMTLVNYNPINGAINKYPIPKINAPYKGGGMIKINGNIIIAGNTIQFFNLSNRQYTAIPEQYKELEKLQNIDITFIQEIDNGFLWMGTKANGLYIFNPVINDILNLNKSNSNLKSNYLTSVFKDRDNNLWLGTFDQGADVSFKRHNNFNFEIQLDNLTNNKFVTCVTTDYNVNYYIGTRSNGLYIYHGGLVRKGEHYNIQNSILVDNHIRSLLIDSKKQLWIGSEKELQLTDLKLNKVKQIDIPLPNQGIVCFCEQDGKIIAGSDGKGFFTLDYGGNILHHELRLGNNITKIIPIGKEEILLSSYGFGLFVYNINTNTYRNLESSIKNGNYKLNEAISMYLDRDSILWVGNFNYGLYKISLTNNDFKVYTEKDGLPNNDVVCIEEDKTGKLWLGTSFGLSRFDKHEEFINYFQNEGLRNIQFHQKASLVDQYGTIYMGGNYGLTFFNPRLMSQLDHNISPEIILKSLNIATKKIVPGDETGILSQVLNNTREITLTHKQKVFSIEYHAFDYIAANKLKYAYMLEGFDKEWNYVGDRNYANYTNIRAGSYTFMVKAQNNIGEWSDVSSLKIKIKPSPFLTVWAFLIYLLIGSSLIFISFRLILNAKLYKNKLELEHRERIRENEIAQMKMRFFTNISHEIRTPLTLIKGNIDILSRDLASKNITFSSFKGLQYSTDRLLALVNQLLSVRKLENDTLDLKVKRDNIITITEKLIQAFRYVAVNRNITIDIKSEFEKLSMLIDEDKYEKIMSNLLSNALKHAKENGSILIDIEMLEASETAGFFVDINEQTNYSFVKISVIDDGFGIPEKDLSKIFNRFEQSSLDSNKPDYSGTGIGLDFTKSLVKLHHGAITVKSEEQKETIFSFVLPVNDEAYKNDIWIDAKTTDETSLNVNEIAEEMTTEVGSQNNNNLVLVVEDDLELNRFIGTALKEQFKVISCYNGKEGIKLAQKHLPDIIISDIMMPEIDGLELCKQVREDELISHIPIILLTAITDVESQISGYKYGADDYISKPFDLSILTARIVNLIQLRKQLQASYKQGIFDEHKIETSNQFELNFIKKIENIISTEYHLPKLNVNYLADELNMSRTSFYRKFMSIMDISPKDFITKYRINKAIELMKNGNDNFGEISFLCGFGSQSNFSVLFKKEKGVSPLQFKKNLT